MRFNVCPECSLGRHSACTVELLNVYGQWVLCECTEANHPELVDADL